MWYALSEVACVPIWFKHASSRSVFKAGFTSHAQGLWEAHLRVAFTGKQMEAELFFACILFSNIFSPYYFFFFFFIGDSIYFCLLVFVSFFRVNLVCQMSTSQNECEQLRVWKHFWSLSENMWFQSLTPYTWYALNFGCLKTICLYNFGTSPHFRPWSGTPYTALDMMLLLCSEPVVIGMAP